MTLHIKRAIAAMAAVLMLLTLVPTAALPTIQLPDLSMSSATVDAPANDADVAPSMDVDEGNASANDAQVGPSANAEANASANNTEVTPSTDASANDVATAPSTDASANNAAAAPSTDASANAQASQTVVTDPAIIEDVLTSEDGFVVGDDNTVYIDADNDGDVEAVQGTVIEDDEDFDPTEEIEDLLANVEQGKNEETEYLAAEENAAAHASPYQPLYTNDDNDPFLPGGDAYIDQDEIYYGAPATPTYPFTDWAANTSFLNTSVKRYDNNGRALKYVFRDVDLIDVTTFGDDAKEQAKVNQNGKTGYAYNRYDAAYDKYGVTIDRNSATVEWTVNKDVHLSETPYLAFSIEQVDEAKLAIAVRIGTPIAWDPETYEATDWEYRWYTITDSNEHLGINYDSTKDNTVKPSVQISELDAPNPVINNAAYTAGALTGCIDMVYWLPWVSATYSASLDFKIDKVQVRSTGQAARINYLYFLNQASTILSPQVNNGAVELGTKKTSHDGQTSDDLNGWRNANAITLSMTGGSSYSITIDSTTATSGVTTYKHNNVDYFDVVIPVRKWLNFSADSRTVQVEMYKRLKSTDSQTGTGELEFSMWGNKTGATLAAYRTSSKIERFHSHSQSEELLFITGHSGTDILQPYCYGTSSGACAQTLEIDKKYNSNYAYNHVNLFDFIQSPYMKSSVYVSDPNKPNYGWAYVSSMRITVPANTGTYKIASVQTRPVEDGLNDFTKNSDGDMVPDEYSYDGGTGVQPVVSTGTVSSEPAAFGPHYYSSEYGITDLLPRNYAVNNDSDAYNDVTRVYGLTAKYKEVGYPGLFFTGYYPSTDVDHNGTISNGTTMTFYAKVTVGGVKYYAYPYIYGQYNSSTKVDNTTVKWGWVVADDFTTNVSSNGSRDQDLYDFKSFTNATAFKNKYSSEEAWTDELYAFMQDKWVFSNMAREGVTNSYGHFTYKPEKIAKMFNTGEYAPVPLAYTNMRGISSFNGDNAVYNSGSLLNAYQNMHVINTKACDASLGNYKAISASRIRMISDPVYVSQDYYLYIDASFSGGSNSMQLLVAGNNNLIYTFHVNMADGQFYGYGGTAVSGVKAGTYVLRVPFKNIFNALSSVENVFYKDPTGLSDGNYMKVIGVALGTWTDSTTSALQANIRRLEVHAEQYEYKDRVVIRDGGPADGKIIDAFNVLEDSVNETLKGNVADANDSTRGRRGWKLGTLSASIQDFDFRATLGHYRLKIGPNSLNENGGPAQVVLTADRDFGIRDYKYLYLSYSVRNPDTNYGLSSSNKTGINFVLKDAQGNSNQYTSVTALVQQANGTLGVKRQYKSSELTHAWRNSLNTAIDLSQYTSDLDSISQIVFYFNNTTSESVHYYINYVYLSNVPPTPGFEENVVNRGFYHNYYLMDSTKGRYARRFPTVDNPSGQVTSKDTVNTDEDGDVESIIPSVNGRVNPLIIERGQQFWEGTYYNGTPLNEFTSKTGTTYKVSDGGDSRKRVLASVFFYHDHEDEGKTDGTGDTGDHWIDQYYKVGEVREELGQYEAYWCYNRWPVGWGLERYIGFEGHDTEGTLMDLHATANQVFLRNGLDPVKYLTTFDTQGGQMVYDGSSEINVDMNGLIENENNYYISNAIMTDYFNWPMAADDTKIDPVKYGYTFKGWFTNPNWGTADQEQLQRWHTKINPYDRTFYARWLEDTSVTAKSITFMRADNKTEWFTRTADHSNEFVVTIPWNTLIETSSGTVPLVGWTVQGGDGKVYTPGMKVTVTKNVVFLPYTNTNHESSLTIIVNNNAKLCAYTGSMKANDLKPITNGYVGIKVTTSGSTTTYTNVPRYTVLVAKPSSTSNASSRAWKVSNEQGHTSFAVSSDNGMTSETVASYDTYYRFAASTNITLSYVTATDQTALVWTSPRSYVSNRQMMFYTQFAVPSGATNVKFGTLYTKDTQYAGIVGSSTSNKDIASKLGAAMKFKNDNMADGALTSAVRYIQASTANDTNQFYLMVTENKGNAVTYYARGFVQYTDSTGTHMLYSDVISVASVGASMDPLGGA